ncbi:unnamed protein product [Kuraishia capsulata CBS 1993]|uniref:Uncharacterized protein n=1 Tax=Kuraishia capsulata CBS 1993 TaxID=1382522 RepID=W6MLN3_9ASCO|nr:uncharacterized protein KUCA_T00002995001 [Kuraishia capsulata CBS 1993]CDK27018.1 unnamed protein product [Kuraishia capsulata CBS 1993]
MTTATSTQPGIHRIPLGALGESKLNIANSKRSGLFQKSDGALPALKRAKLDLGLARRAASTSISSEKSSVDYAQALKTRLRLALYKVKTNQHSLSISQLDKPQKSASFPAKEANPPSLLAASTPLFARLGGKRSVSFMDYIVEQKNESKDRTMPPPILQLPTPNTSVNTSTSSPSKIAQIGRRQLKSISKFTLPPIPNLTPQSQQKAKTESLSLPSIAEMVKGSNALETSPNATIFLQDSSEMMVTPVRRKLGSRSQHQPTNDTTIDQDETQLMSSPSRLLSTPSSIGAAKCLLQLALR